MNKKQLHDVIGDAAARQQKALQIWYPQMGNNAPAERNITLYLAIALADAGASVYSEANIDSARRVDLVAYIPESKTLLVVEAKRSLNGGSARLLRDRPRVAGFSFSPRVRRRWGVLVTTTTIRARASAWETAPERRSGSREERDVELSNFLRDCTSNGGGIGIAPIGGGTTRDRWLLWAFWPDRPDR